MSITYIQTLAKTSNNNEKSNKKGAHKYIRHTENRTTIQTHCFDIESAINYFIAKIISVFPYFGELLHLSNKSYLGSQFLAAKYVFFMWNFNQKMSFNGSVKKCTQTHTKNTHTSSTFYSKLEKTTKKDYELPRDKRNNLQQIRWIFQWFGRCTRFSSRKATNDFKPFQLSIKCHVHWLPNMPNHSWIKMIHRKFASVCWSSL